MLIQFDGATTLIVTGGEELKEWRDSHRQQVPGARFIPQVQSGQWDGYWSPGQWLRRSGGGYVFRCGRGLLDMLIKQFPDAEVSDDGPSVPSIRTRKPDQLYPHQREALAAAYTHTWGRYALATNAGKGAIIALFAEAAAQAGGRVLILSDEIAVVDALQGEIAKWADCPIASVGAGVKEHPGEAPITVAMVPTLTRRLADPEWREWLRGVTAVLLDEADKATSKSWGKVLAALPNTTYRYGFSGSFPDEGSIDDLKLEESIGPIIGRVKNAELVKLEISAKPTVVLHAWQAGLPHMAWRDWKQMGPHERRQWVYDHAIINNAARHRYIQSILDPSVPNAIIVNRIEHGEQLAQTIEGSIFVDGSVTPAQRIKLLDKFKAGDFNILITTKILDRGSNRLGMVGNLIFAAGEGSTRQTLQRLGRGLRREDGKAEIILHDIIDAGHKYLESLAQRRIELYNEEGFPVRIATRAA